MSRQIFEFRCAADACGLVFDEYVAYDDIPSVKCPSCASDTVRQLCAPRIDPRLGLDPASFPTMADKWARIRRQQAKIESSRDSD